MRPLIIAVEGSSGVYGELAHRVEEITGETPIRIRRRARQQLASAMRDDHFLHEVGLTSFLFVGKSAGAASLVDALGSRDGRTWCSGKRVVACFIDYHRPGGGDVSYVEVQNSDLKKCISTWQRCRWPRGAAVYCTCGNNTLSQQTGVDHRTILASDETARLIQCAWDSVMAWQEINNAEKIYYKHDKQENSKD